MRQFAALLILIFVAAWSFTASGQANAQDVTPALKAPPAYGVTPPNLTDKTLRHPLPQPYDEAADPWTDIRAAAATAKQRGTFVLIGFGANWCPDCLNLEAMFALPEFRAFLTANFEIVHVDIGRFNRNGDVVEALGITNFHGAPTVVIVTPDGFVLNAATSDAWVTTELTRDPQDAIDYFARYAPK